MERLLVSLSASELQVKQRVAVNTDAGWFIGTVKLVKTKYATVLFDDGDTAEVLKVGGASDFRILPKDTPKSKRAYKLNEVRAMLEQKKVKESPVKALPELDDSLDDKHTVREEQRAPTPLPPVPRMRVIGQRPVEAAPVSDTKHEHKPLPDELTNHDPVEQLRIVYETQIRGSTNTSEVRRFMLDLWTALNKQKFDGHLRPIKKFLVIPPQGRQGLRAFWHSRYRILVFTTLVLKAKWDKFHEVFLHEMCHQAVTDVDHGGKAVAVGEDGGHGPVWQKWMIKVGLEPKRYDDSTFGEYMTEEERKLFDEHADNAMSVAALSIVRKKEHYDAMKSQRLIPVKNAQVGSFVTLSDGSTEEAAEGVVTYVRKDSRGVNLYTVKLYNDELKNKDWTLSEDDDKSPLFFIRDPKLKYRATARRWAEEARRIARKEGRMR